MLDVDSILVWRYTVITQCHNSMMTSSNGTIFRVTGLSCGEFTGPGEFPAQRPVTRSFDVFFDLRLNKQLSKQPWGWWFETPPWSLWRQCNGTILYLAQQRHNGTWIALFRDVPFCTSTIELCAVYRDLWSQNIDILLGFTIFAIRYAPNLFGFF